MSLNNNLFWWIASGAKPWVASLIAVMMLASTLVAQTTSPAEPATPQAMLDAGFALEKKAYSSSSADDFKAAAEALEKCSQKLPLNVKVERAVGFIYLDKLQDPELAYPHLEKAYAADPNEPGWAYSLAKSAWLIGKTDRQIAVLKEAAKHNPNDKEVASALALAMTLAPATNPAAGYVAHKNAELRQAALALETQAYTTQTQADYQIAAGAMEKYSQAVPGDLQVERSLGFLYLEKLKDPGKAYSHLERAYTTSPEDPSWGLLLAAAAGELKKTDRQIQVLRELVKRDPDDKNAASALAEAVAVAEAQKNARMRQAAFDLETRAYTSQLPADFKAAVDALEKCSQQLPPDLQVERSAGFIYLDKLNDPQHAYLHLEKAYALNPNDSSWAYSLAKAAGLIGKQDRRVAVLREAAKRNPADKDIAVAMVEALALPANQSKTTAEKDAQLRQASFALQTKAYCTQTHADYLAAAEALQNCSQAIPNDLEVERSVGFLYLDKLKDPVRAYPHLEKAYALVPNDSSWGALLAKAAGEAGKTDRQIQVLRELVKRDPSDRDSASALAEALAKTDHAQPTALDHNARMRQAALALQTKAYTTETRADYQAAADALEKCSLTVPNNLEIERSVGFLYLDKLDDPAKAYPHLEKAYFLAPKDTGWGFLLSKAAGAAGKTDRQIQVLWEVLKRDPNDKESAAALVEALEAKADRAENPIAFNNAKMRKAAFSLETQAYTTQTDTDYRAATAAMQTYTEAVPGDLDAERSVGFLYLDKLKDPARAYPHLEKAYAISKEDAGWGSLLAKAAGLTDHGTRQMEVLTEVAKRFADNANAQLEYAQALDKSGQRDKAEKEYVQALKLAPDDEGVLTAYAQFLHTRGRDIEAKDLVDKVLAKSPKSSAALTLEGDIHRNDWDLDDAQAAYQQALAQNPESELAKTGMTEIHHSRAVTLDSSYYYFKGSDHYMQQGLYNTLSLSTSSHIFENATYNMGYFRDNNTKYASVVRYQEGIGIEDRVDNNISIRGGLSAFQMPQKQAFGFDLGVTWKPTSQLWVDATYRTEDPINDSMYTVAMGLSQDILGFTGGYQFNDELALKIAASRSSYSDDVIREFIHIEPNYTLWQATRLRLGAEYETVRYSRQLPGDGGTSWYQTFGPVVEVEPPITSWLSLHARAEFPYVPSVRQWGSNVSFDIKYHPGDHLELKAGVFYVSVPESISSYSGSGVDASISYRF